MKLLISTVVVWFYVKNVYTSDCYWNTKYKYNYFSSKTPYEVVRGDLRDSVIKSEGCEAISVWTIMRHGKRNPSAYNAQIIKDTIKTFSESIKFSYEIGNSSLCAQDVENIKYWEIESDVLEASHELSKEGYQEVMGISRRLRETFPELLNELQEKDYILISETKTKRVHQSAIAFAEGLNNSNIVISHGKSLAPYKTCGKYQAEVRSHPRTYHHSTIYLSSMEYLNMKQRVGKRLGLNFTLSSENITALYNLCRYFWNGINSKSCPWCAVFSSKDLEVLEYTDDLVRYYRNGYGAVQYTKILGQLPLADMLRKFRQAKNGQGKKLVSYVSMSGTMDMITVALNLFKDSIPLTGLYHHTKRKWRVSFATLFSSNIIAVLNRCSKHGENNYDYKVALYWNERPLLELCQKGICSWQEFEDIFKPFLDANIDFCEFLWTKLK